MANKEKKTRGMRILRGGAVLIFWLLVWQLVAMAIARAIVLPTPVAVAKRLGTLLLEKDFLLTCLTSLGRIFVGLAFGIVTGILLASASAASELLGSALTPFVSIIKATPVASIIIVMLFVMGKSTVPMVAAWLMVVPILYMNVLRGIRAVPVSEREVAKIYGFGFGKHLRYCILPSTLPYFAAACRSALGLAWKAGIAAEVICTPKNSIGGKLYDAKIYLESEDLFAWTVVVILLSVFIEKTLVALIGKLSPNGGESHVES